MKNNWLAIWNNRIPNLDRIQSEDETQIILELKKMVGWDFHGNGSQVMFEEIQKEYEYLKDNLKITPPPDYNIAQFGNCAVTTFLK